MKYSILNQRVLVPYHLHIYPDCLLRLWAFAIATQDVHKLVEDIKRPRVGTITREPGPVQGGSTVIAFCQWLRDQNRSTP
ncbi:lactoylglutathione lyase [Salvia divinorum]|uniref:Lactoylglutathione lyase n=1 Tax=Salvia divinorum TaxID=28513 RepID=A0ABD1HV84_SALDI